jgi:hypothetical protein
MDTLYPTMLDPDVSEDEDYEQTVEFKVIITILFYLLKVNLNIYNYLKQNTVGFR